MVFCFVFFFFFPFQDINFCHSGNFFGCASCKCSSLCDGRDLVFPSRCQGVITRDTRGDLLDVKRLRREPRWDAATLFTVWLAGWA